MQVANDIAALNSVSPIPDSAYYYDEFDSLEIKAQFINYGYQDQINIPVKAELYNRFGQLEYSNDQSTSILAGDSVTVSFGKISSYRLGDYSVEFSSNLASDSVIDNILNGRKWGSDPNYKYYQLSREQIKGMWDEKRDKASLAGTLMHYDIECYYNKMDLNNDSIEYKYFLNFINDYPNLNPYRTEWMIWDKELKLAGSIDMVYLNDDDTLSIYDWKRCKEIVRNKRFEEYSITECISHIPNTNFWHYSLQLNVYKYIIEKNYGKKIKELCLVCLHPNNKNKSYIKIDVPILEIEINDLMSLRLNHL